MSNVSVLKRNSSWQYRFDIAKVEGKRKQVSKSGFRTRKEALEAGIQALANYSSSGSVIKDSSLSVSDYLDYWFENYCRMQLKYNTQLGYLNIIENHLKPALGFYYLKNLPASTIQEFANSLKIKGFSKSSVTGIIATLSCALKYAVEPLNYLSHNPCDHVILPKFKEDRTKKRFILSSEEITKILKRFKNSPWFLPLMIGYHTGLRIGEVFALTWKDIDFENKALTVNKIVVKRNYGCSPLSTFKKKGKKEEKSGWYFSSPKTLSSNRTIMIDSILLEALKEEKDKQDRYRKEYGKHFKRIYAKEEIDEKGDTIYRIVEVEEDIPVILREVNMICRKYNGEYASSDGFKYCARVIHHELKIAFNFHSLRHTHATILVQSGAHIKDVQERLGHADVETTLNTYTHNTVQMRRASVSIFEKHLEECVQDVYK